MFRVDQSANRITKLKTVRFSDLGLRERDHLQEWLANSPEALGEDLLIIQKEFAGFDDTKERLDLLALDKQGAFVLIEKADRRCNTPRTKALRGDVGSECAMAGDSRPIAEAAFGKCHCEEPPVDGDAAIHLKLAGWPRSASRAARRQGILKTRPKAGIDARPVGFLTPSPPATADTFAAPMPERRPFLQLYFPSRRRTS